MIENGQRKEVRALSVIAKAKAYIATYAENPDNPDQETLYRCAVSNRMTVDRLKELLDFSEKADGKTMRALKDGTLGIQAAVNLIKLPVEARAEVIDQAKANGTPVSTTTVRKVVRVAKGKSDIPTKAEIRDAHKALEVQANNAVKDVKPGFGSDPTRKAIIQMEAARETIAWILGKGPQPAWFTTTDAEAKRPVQTATEAKDAATRADQQKANLQKLNKAFSDALMPEGKMSRGVKSAQTKRAKAAR